MESLILSPIDTSYSNLDSQPCTQVLIESNLSMSKSLIRIELELHQQKRTKNEILNHLR